MALEESQKKLVNWALDKHLDTMGLFDFLTKKKDSFPENDLERSLIQASEDFSAQEEFYKKLMDAPLVFIRQSPDPSTTQADEGGQRTVEFSTFDDGKIPVFTAVTRVYEGKMDLGQKRCASMKGKDLFTLTQGSTLVLNPFSEYGKEFIPQEIEKLLKGTILVRPETMVVEKNTSIQIGPAQQYPKQMLHALAGEMEGIPEVQAAYLASIRMGQAQSTENLLIGIDTRGSLAEVTHRLSKVAQQFLVADEVLDFIQISEEDGVSGYLLTEIRPFFQR